MNQQNCNICDKPVWLMFSGYYEVDTIEMKAGEDHCVTVDFRRHECKEEVEKEDEAREVREVRQDHEANG